MKKQFALYETGCCLTLRPLNKADINLEKGFPYYIGDEPGTVDKDVRVRIKKYIAENNIDVINRHNFTWL